MAAEVVKHFFPKLVELHNYTPAHSTQQKLSNWSTLNRQVYLFVLHADSNANTAAPIWPPRVAGQSLEDCRNVTLHLSNNTGTSSWTINTGWVSKPSELTSAVLISFLYRKMIVKIAISEKFSPSWTFIYLRTWWRKLWSTQRATLNQSFALWERR